MAGVGTWSCFNSLEELSVNIEWDLHGYTPPLDDLTDEELQDQSMALYEILARFRNIKVLDLQNVLGASRFQFVLSMGLSLLSGLTNLEVIKFPGRQEMRPQDVEWIIENLVSLRVFGGRKLTTGYSRYILRECPWDCALATMFNASGIKTPGSVYSDSFKSKCGELDWTLPVSEPEVDDVVEKQDMMDTVEDWNVFDEDIFQ
ncbi:hypothetical protein BGZ76_004696 [Entomortierella beljakovae]|nr:hypothetical protein BGZ76_004696 [Entomortierella beljakovae]